MGPQVTTTATAPPSPPPTGRSRDATLAHLTVQPPAHASPDPRRFLLPRGCHTRRDHFEDRVAHEQVLLAGLRRVRTSPWFIPVAAILALFLVVP
jgi:hypothetical protein